ncbi:MAG: helix-turn-helix domain-containing protein [Dethiobacter sp.]|jgi:excisionase family DNA binding protein|nr:helix-turn-helix domain-containing protein [Dethiobacter sp.]
MGKNNKTAHATAEEIAKIMEKPYWTREEAAKVIGVGINQMSELINNAEVPVFRYGGIRRIPRDEFVQWISDKSFDAIQIRMAARGKKLTDFRQKKE